ncbi:MAG: response regulator [Gammaproteobacteria bacterium]|nr:response regulator [Gammaproteobacteria bacterium]
MVEDSPIVAERLRECLKEVPGITHVDTLNREATAIERLLRGDIDVIILDLHLERGTGFGVLRSLKALDGRRPLAIIFTNYDLPEYRRQALALGAHDFLDKARDFERIPTVLSDLRAQRC